MSLALRLQVVTSGSISDFACAAAICSKDLLLPQLLAVVDFDTRSQWRTPSLSYNVNEKHSQLVGQSVRLGCSLQQSQQQIPCK